MSLLVAFRNLAFIGMQGHCFHHPADAKKILPTLITSYALSDTIEYCLAVIHEGHWLNPGECSGSG